MNWLILITVLTAVVGGATCLEMKDLVSIILLLLLLLLLIGYWISHRAVKLVYDIEDGFRQAPAGTDIKILKDEVYKYFNVR